MHVLCSTTQRTASYRQLGLNHTDEITVNLQHEISNIFHQRLTERPSAAKAPYKEPSVMIIEANSLLLIVTVGKEQQAAAAGSCRRLFSLDVRHHNTTLM
jgi:hypothetical protein